MIVERDGKFYRKVEKEEEIGEVEYLREKVKELEERINSLPAISIQPAPVVVCPCPCPKQADPYPYQPYQPVWITTTGTGTDIGTITFTALTQA